MQKPTVGAIFSLICVLGIVACFFPSKCLRAFNPRKDGHARFYKNGPNGLQKGKLTLQGHHPSCGNFSPHVFRVVGKILCAGCTGLALGAMMAIFGTAAYFFVGLHIGRGIPLALLLGYMGVVCGLLQYLFDIKISSIRLAVNAFFVLGIFLLLMGVDAAAQNMLIDLYLVALGTFWLYARIMLSQVDHRKTCQTCGIRSCEFRWTGPTSAGEPIKGANDYQYSDDDNRGGPENSPHIHAKINGEPDEDDKCAEDYAHNCPAIREPKTFPFYLPEAFFWEPAPFNAGLI